MTKNIMVTTLLSVGTRILTPRGEVRLKKLTWWDCRKPLTGPLPVKWIGRARFTKGASSSWHTSVAPIGS